MKIALVCLSLDELPGLQVTLPALPLETVDEYFAVDGGSTDGTLEFYAQHHFPVVSQVSKGRGEAFRIAFKSTDADALIFFSPDGNEDPADIAKFRPLLEAGHDIVIGTRMVKGARNEEDDQIFKWRKWANNAFNLMAYYSFRRGHPFVSDSINGFRAITRQAWERLSPDGPGYTIEYQTTIRALKHRLKIAEFATREGNRIGPEKGSPSISTGIAFLKLYFRELRS